MSILLHYSKRLRRRLQRAYGRNVEDIQFVGSKPIVAREAAAGLLREWIERGRPFMVGRFGTTEASALEFCLDAGLNGYIPVPRRIRTRMSQLTGFYPPTSAFTYRYVNEFLRVASQFDIVGCRTRAVFGNYLKVEEDLVLNLCPQAVAMDLDVIYDPFSPYFTWIDALAGKRVLVIHPFADLIEKQYRLMQARPTDVRLPLFELETLSPPQTLANSADRLRWPTWFDALEWAKAQIQQRRFDVALIAAGSYGPFLAHFCKSIGAVGINVGGGLQLFFQIGGRRWLDPESKSYVPHLNLEYWTRPTQDLRPDGFEMVEEGCYW